MSFTTLPFLVLVALSVAAYYLLPQRVQWMALLAASTLAAGAAQWALGVCTRKVSALAANDMRLAAFRNLSRLPLAYFDSHPHGDIISRMTNDAELVAEGLLQGLTQLLPGVATILGTLVIMAVLNPFIAFVVVAVTPVSIWFAGFVAKRTAGFFAANSAAQGRLSGFVNEMVAGQEVVRAFGCEAACEAQFAEMTDELYTTGLKSVFYSSVTNPGTRFVNAIVYAAVGVFGAVSAIGGGITVGQLSSFLTYANQYTKPFNEVTGVLTQMQTALASAGRLLDVIDQTPETPDAPDALAPAACEGRVDVEDVCFSYTREKPLIEHFELHVKPGQRVAIVGPTGCGKTTFLNSLTHLYEPTAGNILLDGEEIDLRKHNIAYIFQEYSAMEWLTVRENVRFGLDIKRDYKNIDEKVNNALDLVGLTPFADYYPKQLSASMLQRVVIARAFATQPDLLLMDEPYGQLDINLRFKLEDEVIRLCKQTKTTVLFITHNIEEAVYLGDRILVLTNKPTSIKEIVPNDAPHPRDIAAPNFIEMRNRITNLIKWW